MLLFCFCWKVLVPKVYGPPRGHISPIVAETLWNHYLDNPGAEQPVVMKMRRHASEMWLVYVGSN